MAQMSRGLVAQVKAALLGDVARYSATQYQASISHSPLRELDKRSGRGRGYATSGLAEYAVPAQPTGRSVRVGIGAALRWVKSIGDYNETLTR